MPERIFWDTWAFIGLADVGSRYYPLALAINNELAAQAAVMITTQAVLTEVGNTFSKKPFRNLVRKQLALAQEFVAHRSGQIISVDPELWDRAWELYLNRSDKDWGHTDCIIFIVMQDLGLSKAFTADQHFEQAGFIRLVHV